MLIIFNKNSYIGGENLTSNSRIRIAGAASLIILAYTALHSLNNSKYIPSIFGFSIGTVLSGSMYPTLNPGDAIITTKNIKNLRPKDIITYYEGDELVTHRILKINGSSIITEGDANNVPDLMPIQSRNVIGVYIVRIPLAGYIITFIKGPLFISAAASFILFLFIYEGLKESDYVLEGDIRNEKEK